MKKTISFILVLCLICCNSIIPLAAGDNEAKITSPSNGDWIDPYKAITVKWTTPSSGLSYRVTIKNERTGKYIVQNEKVNGSSYSIKSNTLDFEERYVIWVGTYDGSTSLGHGDSITVSMNSRNSSQKIYQEADFSYPLNNQEIPADKDLKITLNGNSDLAYNLTVKDTTSGKTIVNESGLTKTSYTIKSSLLTEGHSYKAWVGTYKKASVEKKEFGAGKSIEFKTQKATVNEPPERPVVDTTGGDDKPERPTVDTGSTPAKSYEATEIISPSDKEWLDPTKKITIKWDNSSSDLEYCLSVKDDVTGEYIVNNEYISNSSYNIKANTLTAEHRYKISLSTYADDTLVGSDEIYINMNDIDYEEADFSSPFNEDIVKASNKLTIKFSNINSDFCYRLSIIDNDTNKSIIKNKVISGNTYSLNANTLEQGKEYKLWIGTYINSNASEAVGKGNTIYIYTEEEEKEIENATVEAVFSAPENNDIVNYKKDLTIKWKKSDVDTCFELTIKDTTDNSFIVKNEIVSGTSYKIKSSKLKAKHQYKAWIGTYNNSSNDKKLIGKGDEIYFSTDGTIPVLVKSLNAELEDEGLVFKYEFTGDDFGYATVVVTDSKGKTIYNEKVYDLNGEIIIESDKLEENYTYTCEIQTYSSNGEKAAYKSQKYTVAKSGFSVTGVTKPIGELTYKKGFTVKGEVGSAYPITDAKIVIFTKGNENDIKDIVHLKNYNQTAKNPNKFNIKDYDSEVNFGTLIPGEYAYKVTVVDTMGNNYTAVESNFSIVREKGTYDDVPSNHKNYEAIKQLSLDGILAGDGTGKFRPNASITRAEVAKILCCAYNLQLPTNYKNIFSDVSEESWAWEYIHSAYNNGVVVGRDYIYFVPDGNVTYAEAAKMLVVIKGWIEIAIQEGNYPKGTNLVAKINGFFENTAVENNENYNNNATRADIAQMFYNAINKNPNSISKADKEYTINGVTLYAYRYDTGYYVDASLALKHFGVYDDKNNSELSGTIKYWSNNIVQYGSSLQIPYDLTNKNYDNIEIEFSNGEKLCNSKQKNYFKKTTVQMTVRNGKPYINLDDLVMLVEYSIQGINIVPTLNKTISIRLKDGYDDVCFQQKEVEGLNIYIIKGKYAALLKTDALGNELDYSESQRYSWHTDCEYFKVDEYGTITAKNSTGGGSVYLKNSANIVVASATVNVVESLNIMPLSYLNRTDSYVNIGGNNLIKNMAITTQGNNYRLGFDFYNELYIPMQLTVYDEYGTEVNSYITGSIWGETGIIEGMRQGFEGLPIFWDMISGDAWKPDYVVPNANFALDSFRGSNAISIPKGGYLTIDFPQDGNDAQIAFVLSFILRTYATANGAVELAGGETVNINKVLKAKNIKTMVTELIKVLGKESCKDLTNQFMDSVSGTKEFDDVVNVINKMFSEQRIEDAFMKAFEIGLSVGGGALESAADKVIMKWTKTDFILEPVFAAVDIGQWAVMLKQGADAQALTYKTRKIITTDEKTRIVTHGGSGKGF